MKDVKLKEKQRLKDLKHQDKKKKLKIYLSLRKTDVKKITNLKKEIGRKRIPNVEQLPVCDINIRQSVVRTAYQRRVISYDQQLRMRQVAFLH